MTAVHFLHQTDIGLALRKHKAIYGITPTLFSPSLSFSPSRVCLCALQTRARRRARHSRRPKLVPFSSAGFSPSPRFASLRRPWHSRLAAGPSLSALVCVFPPLRDCFAGDLTAVINDLGGPGGRQRGAVRKHNMLVIPLQTSLLLTAAVFYPSAHYDFWGGREDLRFEGYIWVKFGVITHLEPWVSTEQLFVLFPQRPGPL